MSRATGAGAEAGAVPEGFRPPDPDARSRDPKTFCLFAEAGWRTAERETYEPTFGSASIDEMDDAYSLRFRYFVDRAELEAKLIDFVESYVVPLRQGRRPHDGRRSSPGEPAVRLSRRWPTDPQ